MEAPGSGSTSQTPSSLEVPADPSRRAWRATGLTPSLHTVAQARRDVRGLLISWGVEAGSWETELLFAEVAGNAVRHARTRFDILLAVDRATLRCEVTDADPRIPQLDDRPLDAEGGRGLRLVDELSDHWGVSVHNEGKTVWFQLTVSAAERGPA